MAVFRKFIHTGVSQRCCLRLIQSPPVETADDLIDAIGENRCLQFKKEETTVTTFYMMDSLATFGKVCILCFEETVPHAVALFRKVKFTLLQQCAFLDTTAE